MVHVPHHPHIHRNHADGTAAANRAAARRHHLRQKGRFAYDQKKADRAGTKLALKNHMIAMIGEFVGTCLFMIFALGGTNVALTPATTITGQTAAGEMGSAASTVNTSNLLYIALSFGFSLAVNAWIFFRVSGGLFNPAVSLGMCLVGAVTPTRAALLSFVQILGGIVGAAIIDALTPGPINVRTSLGGGTSVAQGLFLEMFLTALLMLSILLLVADKNKATFIAPIGIGLALFVAELLGVYYTGGSLNPARSFGPCVVLRSFEGYHWIYWLGPYMGAVLAAGFYKLLKWLQFETVLGPEDGEPVSGKHEGAGLDAGAGRMQDDEEKQAESTGAKKGTMANSGPGMGDYHTETIHTGSYWDHDDASGGRYNEDQLNRIEAMLLGLYGNGQPQSSETLHHAHSNDSEADHLRSVKNPLIAPTILPNDSRYSTATVVDSQGRSKAVYK